MKKVAYYRGKDGRKAPYPLVDRPKSTNLSKETMIIRAEERSEFYTPEGCHITESFNEASHPGFSLARARVEAGVSTRWHRVRDTDEVYYLLAGTGLMEIEGEAPAVVGPGDTVLIPAGREQRITNTGLADLVFLCVCHPSFAAANYEDRGAAG